MKIKLIQDAKQAKGVAVVIDVLRAATVAAFILGNNAKYIIPVKTKEEAFLLKEAHPDYILVGENNGYKIKGFDYGNSPSEIKNIDFMGKIVVHRSSNGTQGLVNAQNADKIIFGSFVTFSAIKKYIERENPDIVSLLPTVDGDSDDEQFAYYLYKNIRGYETDINEIKSYIKSLGSVFLNPNFPEFPEEDFHLALSLDLFSFICLTDIRDGRLIVRKQEIDN